MICGFHTLQVQGSHVILRTQGVNTDEMLTLAARYAAYFSRARESSKVAVDYTPVKFIKKTTRIAIRLCYLYKSENSRNRPERTGIKQRNKFLRISQKSSQEIPYTKYSKDAS